MSLIVKLNEIFYDIPVLYFLTKEKKEEEDERKLS